MRIGTLSRYIYITQSTKKQFERISTLLRNLSTGKRTDLYETSPQEVYNAVRTKTLISQNEQFENNVKYAKNFLLIADDTLGKVYDNLLRVKEKLVQGSNALSDDDKINLAEELKELKNRLLQLAKTKVGNYYLFSGTAANQTDPFQNSNTGDYTYTGSSNEFLIKVSPTEKVPIFFDGSAIFGSGTTSVFQIIDNAITKLENGETLADTTYIQDIENYISKTDKVRGRIGAYEQVLNSMENTYSDILINLRKRVSNIEDTPYEETISQYQTAQTYYQALISILGKEISSTPVLLKYF